MVIIKNRLNIVALTLSEKASTANPEWLLALKNDTTGETVIVPLYDVSDSYERKRANIFEIKEGIEGLYINEISLNPTGQWSYTAYEMAPSSPRNMDPSQALKIVEIGRCQVENPEETKNNFFNEEENKNSPVFEG